MYRKEVNAQSPLRILEKSIHGGLGKGNLGLVMARAGVGKTACLIQIGLDDLMRERPVLHVALGQTTEHVQCWYDALFDDLVIQSGLENPEAVRAMIADKRIIASFADHDLWPDRLEKTVEMFKEHAHFKPAAVLVDGFDWSAHDVAENAAILGAFKTYAKLLDAELWMSAQTHRSATGPHPEGLPPPYAAYGELIDVALYLEPVGDDITLRLLKDHDDAVPPITHLHLHPDTLRLVVDEDERPAPWMPNSAFTLLSGGAQGAEAEFGACAERWGMVELNFSFEGRTPARQRAIVRLSEEELQAGAVSPVYVQAHMHRTYPTTPAFAKTLQSIWHQVQSAGEVFAVGTILPDNTVKGGTGWAVELGRTWRKPVHVYDQARNGWFTWRNHEWAAEPEPKITQRRFTGTGTRFLTDDGKRAIHALFERSFGPAGE
jgi:hypothetical protein